MPWAQYLRAVAEVPQGSELVEEPLLFWELARRLGPKLDFCGVALDMATPPAIDYLIELMTAGSIVPIDEIRQFPDGHLFNLMQYVQPANADAGLFEPAPEDVISELATLRAEAVDHADIHPSGKRFTHRLAVRRSKELLNTQGLYVETVRKRIGFNPDWMNPDDMRAIGLVDDDHVMLVSRRDRIQGAVRGDSSLRPGAIAMSHAWGGLPDEGGSDYKKLGSCTNLLLDGDYDIDDFAALAVMSGVPIYIEKLPLTDANND